MTGLSVVDLERVASHGWQATATVDLGEWRLRAGGGFTGRANSVLPLGSSARPLDQALVEVAEFYRARGLPAMFQIPQDEPGSDLAILDAELAGRGWTIYHPAEFLTAPLTVVLQSCPAGALPAALLDPVPSPDWLAGYQYRGDPVPAAAIEVLTSAELVVFASVSDAGGQAGVARGAVHDGWLGVTAVTVSTQRQRSGIGRHLMGELARWAGGHSAHHIYLQVDRANDAALAFYRRLGFTSHHRYHYRRQPAP